MNQIKKILVCVTQQKTCERLIKKAASLQIKYNSELFVIHVTKSNLKFLNNEREGEALEYLFSVSKAAGASLSVLKSDNILESIVNFVTENNIDCVIIGQSPSHHKKDSHFYNELSTLLGNVDIQVVPKEEMQ